MKYDVTTWDPETEQYTPQIGLPQGPFTREQMYREIIPRLRELGYGSEWDPDAPRSGSPCVLIEQVQ